MSFLQFFHYFLRIIISRKYRDHFDVIFTVNIFVFLLKVPQPHIPQMTFLVVLEIEIRHQMLWIFLKLKFLFNMCCIWSIINLQFHVFLNFIPYATNIYLINATFFRFAIRFAFQKFLYCLTFSKFFKKQLFPLQELFILFYLWCHPYLSINHTYNLFQIHFMPLQSNWHLFYYVNYSLQYVDQHFQ